MLKLLPCALLLAVSTLAAPVALTTPALANYSCEPGQPDCVPMGVDNAPYKTDFLLIACRVAGDPEALPDDLRFRNVGDATIPAGSRVLWQMKQTGEHGTFFISRDLPVGADIDDVDVLKAGLPAKTRCLSRLA